MFATAFYNNTSDGFATGSSSVGTSYHINCTYYGNGGDGVDLLNSGSSHRFINCSSSGNGGYGWNLGTDPTSRFDRFDRNHTHGNTSGASDQTLPGENQTGDPLFADAAGGDFTPLTGSPLIDNGFNNLVIGAFGNLSGGGSTVFVDPGLTLSECP
jgi:hypothetical protein